jgi:pimeloyl-ACP methyl ester carboxylesterase
MSILILEIVLGVLILLVFGVSVYGATEITRISPVPLTASPADFGLRYETCSFPTSHGLNLRGWFVPADRPSPVTLLIQHGLGSNAGDMLPCSVFLRNGGQWNLFYYHFRGHGDSEGNRTSLGPWELEDMRHAMRFLKSHWPDQTRRLGLYGHSLGAAVGLIGAAEMPEIEAVIAENSFSHISRTIRRFAWVFYRIPYFPFIPLSMLIASWHIGARVGDFAPVRFIGRLAPRPVFLIHGELDRRMPKSDVRALWDAARDPKELWAVPGAGHGDAWQVVKGEYERRMTQFFEKVFNTDKS